MVRLLDTRLGAEGERHGARDIGGQSRMYLSPCRSAPKSSTGCSRSLTRFHLWGHGSHMQAGNRQVRPCTPNTHMRVCVHTHGTTLCRTTKLISQGQRTLSLCTGKPQIYPLQGQSHIHTHGTPIPGQDRHVQIDGPRSAALLLGCGLRSLVITGNTDVVDEG